MDKPKLCIVSNEVDESNRPPSTNYPDKIGHLVMDKYTNEVRVLASKSSTSLDGKYIPITINKDGEIFEVIK